MAIVMRPRIIRDVWRAVFGEDVSTKPVTGKGQHRVLCPFHSESKPSCDVSVEKNAFTCRSCDAHGGALDVVVLAGNAPTHSAAIDWLKAHGVNPC